jgi:chromosome partitioning protein
MITSIASQKGGTGKSSTAISLAAGLAKRGKKILLIDVDSQANSSKVLIPDYPELTKEATLFVTILAKKPLPIRPTKIPNLDMVPSHILLSNTDVELTTAIDHREARLKSQLDRVKDRYDHILLDCPPALSWLTINAFTASDNTMIVISPGYFELDSIVQINRVIGQVQENFNPDLAVLGYLFTMSDPTINSQTSLTILRKMYSDKLFKTVIPRNTDLRDAHFNKQDVFSSAPHSKSARAYERLIHEVFHL